MTRVWWWLVFGVGLGALPPLALWLFDQHVIGFHGAVRAGYLLAFASPILGATGGDLMLVTKGGPVRDGLLGFTLVVLAFSFVLLSAVAGNAPNLTPGLRDFSTNSLTAGCLLVALGNVIFSSTRPDRA